MRCRAAADRGGGPPHRAAAGRRSRVACALLAGLLAGCSLGQGSEAARRERLLISPSGLMHNDCVVLDEPAALPAVDVLVDSVALRAALRALPLTERDGGGYVLLAMRWEDDGINSRREVVEASVSPLMADSVQKLVFQARRELPELTAPLDLRLRIDLRPTPAMHVGHSEYCPPRPRDPALRSALLTEPSRGLRYRGGVRERTVHVELQIHPAGYVVGGRIVRGAGEGSSLERDVVTHLRQFSFDPASIDGKPVRGAIVVPVRVRD